MQEEFENWCLDNNFNIERINTLYKNTTTDALWYLWRNKIVPLQRDNELIKSDNIRLKWTLEQQD